MNKPGATIHQIFFAETTTVTVPAHLAWLLSLFKIAGNSNSFMGGWLSRIISAL